MTLPKNTNLNFGDYIHIAQLRYGSDNSLFVHKVINTLISNCWVDVPVQVPAQETIHTECVNVVSCICCGVCETEVLKYRICDVEKANV